MNTKTKLAFREGIVPILGLIGITGILVAIFYLCLKLGQGMGFVIPPHVDDGEEVDPNPLRLGFMIVGFAISMLLAYLADKKGQEGKIYPAFWLGYTGGTLIWQSVGEASWHFSLPCGDFLICFAHLESGASLWLVLMTAILLAYCYRRRAFGWGAWVFILTFVGNWFGHFIQIGTYPLVSQLMEEGEWYMIVGAAIGLTTVAAALWLNFRKANSIKQRLLCCLMLYFGIGIIVTGVGGL